MARDHLVFSGSLLSAYVIYCIQTSENTLSAKKLMQKARKVSEVESPKFQHNRTIDASIMKCM